MNKTFACKKPFPMRNGQNAVRDLIMAKVKLLQTYCLFVWQVCFHFTRDWQDLSQPEYGLGRRRKNPYESKQKEEYQLLGYKFWDGCAETLKLHKLIKRA